MSLDELKQLKGDQMALKAFVKGMKNPYRERHERDLLNMRKDVDKLLSENQELVTQLQEQKCQLFEKVSKCNAEKSSVAELHGQLQQRYRKDYSVPALAEKLQMSSLEDEEKSDAIAEEFIAGNVDVEVFRKEYIEARSRYHLRKVKKEKLNQHRKYY